MPQSPLTGSFLHGVQPVHEAVEAGAEERGVPRHGGGRGEASIHHQERSQASWPQCRRYFLRFRFRLLKSYRSGSPTFAQWRFRVETILKKHCFQKKISEKILPFQFSHSKLFKKEKIFLLKRVHPSPLMIGRQLLVNWQTYERKKCTTSELFSCI